MAVSATTATEAAAPILRLQGIDRRFGGVHAVRGVDQNLGVATALADRVVVTVSGSIATETTSQQLLADPEQPKRFLGVEPLAEAA
jgi:ABC-type branched-subunit amino acid transport system ATPase component